MHEPFLYIEGVSLLVGMVQKIEKNLSHKVPNYLMTSSSLPFNSIALTHCIESSINILLHVFTVQLACQSKVQSFVEGVRNRLYFASGYGP